jgi:hypothetical protein
LGLAALLLDEMLDLAGQQNLCRQGHPGAAPPPPRRGDLRRGASPSPGAGMSLKGKKKTMKRIIPFGVSWRTWLYCPTHGPVPPGGLHSPFGSYPQPASRTTMAPARPWSTRSWEPATASTPGSARWARPATPLMKPRYLPTPRAAFPCPVCS